MGLRSKQTEWTLPRGTVSGGTALEVSVSHPAALGDDWFLGVRFALSFGAGVAAKALKGVISFLLYTVGAQVSALRIPSRGGG